MILFLVAGDEEEEGVGKGRMAAADPASTGKWKGGPSGESRTVAMRMTMVRFLLRCHSDPASRRLGREEEEEVDVVDAAEERHKGSGDWLLRCRFLLRLPIRKCRRPDDTRTWMLLLPPRRRETVADVVVVEAVRSRQRAIGRQQRREQRARRRRRDFP